MHSIFERIQANDLAGVRAILVQDPGAVHANDRALGSTPLHFAAHRGFEGIVDALLDAGADVHAIERVSGTTPLHWAAEGGHAWIMAKLLARGASIDATDTWYGLTPLGWATVVVWNPRFHEDRPGTARALLAAGAHVGSFEAVALGDPEELKEAIAADPESLAAKLGFVGWGITPLHLAVDRGNGTVVLTLLDAGADPNAASDLGFTPLAHALAAANAGLAVLLRERGGKDDAGSALAAKDLAAMEASLDGAPQESLDRWLFAAARSGYADAVALLTRRGADPDSTLRHLLGEAPAPVSALHAAVKAKSVATVRALLDAGANPNPGVTERWPTPLHVAAGAGHLELVALLLERGADRTARDRDHDATPAGWAEFAGHADVAGML